MSEAPKRVKIPAFTESQALVLAALFKATKEDPDKIITLDDLLLLTGMEKSHVSKILSSIRKMEHEWEIIRTTRSQRLSGYSINAEHVVTSALTARILLNLRKKTSQESTTLEIFKQSVLSAPFFLKEGATEAIFNFKMTWALKVGYVHQFDDARDYIRASQRVDGEAFYLEKIALPDS